MLWTLVKTASLPTNRTSLVFVQRLSTIRDADLILMMEDGRIVERGTHDELIDLRGAYADLYNSQFTGSQVEARATSNPVDTRPSSHASSATQ